MGEHGVSNWSKPFAHFPSLRFVGLLSLVKNLNSVLHACLVSKHANLPVLPKWKALTDYGSSYRGEVIVTTSVLTCELAKVIMCFNDIYIFFFTLFASIIIGSFYLALVSD